MKKIILIASGISLLALTGCISQEEVDAKMAKGCEAALMAQLGADKVKDAKMTATGGATQADGTFRKVEMTYVENGSFDQTPKPVKCLFSEQWGAGKSSHSAILEQLDINGTTYGKVDGVVKGALEDFLKLTEAAARAMGQ